MTKEELKKAIGIRREIESIQLSLEHPKSTYVTAFYMDYSTGIGVPRTEEGEDGGRKEREELQAKLKRKTAQLQRMLTSIQDFIDGVEDPEMRAILRHYYVTGLTQNEIAERLYCDRSTVAKKLEKFWKENE